MKWLSKCRVGAGRKFQVKKVGIQIAVGAMVAGRVTDWEYEVAIEM